MWIIFSRNEQDSMWQLNDYGAHKNYGYWSNDFGWTWKDLATRFTDEEKETYHLPISGVWVKE